MRRGSSRAARPPGARDTYQQGVSGPGDRLPDDRAPMITREQEMAAAAAATQDAADQPWSRLVLSNVSVGAVSSLRFLRHGPGGESRGFPFECDQALDGLREAMADEHGTWLTCGLEMASDGWYSFSYNYDDRPTWPDGREIASESLIADLKLFPRPWAEVPDWHPVKEQYTEVSWAPRRTTERWQDVFGSDQEQLDVIRQAIKDAVEGDWTSHYVELVTLGDVTSVELLRKGPGGEDCVTDTTVHRPYRVLRKAMVGEHGAWLSSTLTPPAPRGLHLLLQLRREAQVG
jgi:hypothetical protein